ncbi:MAG: hypothetical protein WA789_16280 [Candidatus Acidiferrum sp.]
MKPKSTHRFPDWICGLCGYRMRDDGSVKAAQKMGKHLWDAHGA